ncbi:MULTISPECIES: AI-2E family transporter [unclassified Cryobacterium]|uniref:AI-2E family transporter n=1 Tax=unclassified Cryobacterium TaxID=2649013 RepID=UPI002AB3BFAF|nr:MULTISPECIES: AI-2E family transporter [unclassified Cryobacterium]MDY7527120.1 AI-2E family transporter [Cryobacterium sp. 10C2]MEB0003088.1 AI-2E family transporter [Cryobacterium sp. RTC2.1]MEB0286248.1 AI-2E family transporter [Cryobacterium sp. 10S3]MEB0290250.1 AI-2E family transporter [Cryobacterium sp. 10C2]WPX14583.1 AI-2E family transporter [Cryobacterium sp. 10S3]
MRAKPERTPQQAQRQTPRQTPAESAGSEHSGARDSTLKSLLVDRLGWLSIRSAQLIVVIVLGIGVVFALVQLKLVVIPTLVALILAAALSPLVRWLRARGVPRTLATWLTLLGGVVVLGGIVTLIVFAVRNQWSELVTAASDGLDQLQGYLTTGPLSLDATQFEAARNAVIGFVTSAEFGSGALAGVSAAAEVLTGAALVVVILFFFLKDAASIWAFFLTPLRGSALARARRIGTTAPTVLGQYVRGTATIALFDGVVIGASLAILQVPLALPLAAIVFLTAFIPLIGATIAGILAALVALVFNGPIVALIVVVIVVVVNQLEGDLLNPIVMAGALKLHPLVILVALTAGTVLGGIAGAVLAVPLVAVAWSIVRVWDHPVAPSPPPRRFFRGKSGAGGTSAAARVQRDG